MLVKFVGRTVVEKTITDAEGIAEFVAELDFNGQVKVSVVDLDSYEIIDTAIVDEKRELREKLAEYLGQDVLVKIKEHAPKSAATVRLM